MKLRTCSPTAHQDVSPVLSFIVRQKPIAKPACLPICLEIMIHMIITY